jgi:hypothetical protein
MRHARVHRLHDDAGDIIVGGLLKVVAALLVLGLILYEASAIAVNHFQVDSLAGEAVRAGAGTPPQQRTHATVERAVLAALEGSDARLEQLDVSGEEVELTVSRTARVLLLDRIPPAAGLVTAVYRKSATFR